MFISNIGGNRTDGVDFGSGSDGVGLGQVDSIRLSGYGFDWVRSGRVSGHLVWVILGFGSD
jgi:hypothetical protein